MILDGQGSGMSIERAAAQMVFADLRFGKIDFELSRTLARKGIGGFCLYGGSLFETFPLVNSLQKIAPIPLLMCADMENGAGHQVRGATVFPPNMAIAAAPEGAEFARQKGLATAREATALGTHMIFAPVVDVNRVRDNPIVNTRAFGDRPETVIRLARAFTEGCRQGKALTCLKHFPGHGGTAVDSHLALPVIDDPADVIRETDLRPFKALLNDADSVMTAHIVVRALDADRPASLSARITGALLRDELGYNGVVFTDALIMQAIADTYGEAEAVLLAVEAGADVILYPGDPLAAVATIVSAVESGRISPARISVSRDRILSLKKRTPLFENPMTDPEGVERCVGTTAHRAAARRMAEASIVALRDPSHIVPVAKGVAVASCDIGGDHKSFWEGLKEGGIPTATSGAPMGIAAVTGDPRAYHGRITLTPGDVRAIEEFAADKTALLVVIFGSPYIAGQVPANCAVLCAWSPAETMQRAAAAAVAGTSPITGALPIAL